MHPTRRSDVSLTPWPDGRAGSRPAWRRRYGLLVGRLTLLFLVAAHASTASAAEQDAYAAASAKVDQLFAKFTEGIQPGAGVLVIDRGKIVHRAAYGYADIAQRVPLTVDGTFRLDSVSKQFTAMAIMLLKKDGKLAYDDPISRYCPELAVYPGVTIRHLLTHTGGLPEYYDEIVKISNWPSNADARRLLGQMAKPVFTPGSRHEYSNPGYDMLAEVAEAASGMRFADFVRQRIFMPAGMTHSLVHDHTRPTVERRVLGYDPPPKDAGKISSSGASKGGGFTLNDEDPLNGIVGSGGVFSTLDDMFQWDQVLYGEKLVSRATLDEAFTPATLNDGEKTDYGFGWRVSEYRQSRRLSHGGSWVGFRSHIARHPGIGLTVVILSNRSDFDSEAYVDRVTDIYMNLSRRFRGTT